MIRSFLAIELPLPIQSLLIVKISGLIQSFPPPITRWVKSGNIHLTLKFLGDASASHLEQLAGLLQQAFSETESFPLSFSKLGVFPNHNRPRIIWVGVEPADKLVEIFHRIDEIAGKIGFSSEERQYSPHITLARISDYHKIDPKNFSTTLSNYSFITIPTVPVHDIKLFKSELKPAGPTYTNLFTIKLR